MDPSDENEEAWLYGEDAEDSAGETTTEAASLVVPSSADAPDEEMPLMLPTVKAFQDEDTSDSPSDVKHEVIDPRFPTTISSSRVEADDEDLDVKEPEQLSAPPDVPEDEEAVPESQPESRITEATVTEEDISSDSDDDNINVTIDAGKVASLPTTPFHKGFAIDNKSTAASFPAPLTKGIMSIPTTSAGSTLDTSAPPLRELNRDKSNSQILTVADLDTVGTINGLNVLDVGLERDFEEKPWRRPGADITDYFNYGFTEETWILYCERQRKLRMESGVTFPKLFNARDALLNSESARFTSVKPSAVAATNPLPVRTTHPGAILNTAITPTKILNNSADDLTSTPKASTMGAIAGTNPSFGSGQKISPMADENVPGAESISPVPTTSGSTIQVMTADKREYSSRSSGGAVSSPAQASQPPPSLSVPPPSIPDMTMPPPGMQAPPPLPQAAIVIPPPVAPPVITMPPPGFSPGQPPPGFPGGPPGFGPPPPFYPPLGPMGIPVGMPHGLPPSAVDLEWEREKERERDWEREKERDIRDREREWSPDEDRRDRDRDYRDREHRGEDRDRDRRRRDEGDRERRRRHREEPPHRSSYRGDEGKRSAPSGGSGEAEPRDGSPSRRGRGSSRDREREKDKRKRSHRSRSRSRSPSKKRKRSKRSRS